MTPWRRGGSLGSLLAPNSNLVSSAFPSDVMKNNLHTPFFALAVCACVVPVSALWCFGKQADTAPTSPSVTQIE